MHCPLCPLKSKRRALFLSLAVAFLGLVSYGALCVFCGPGHRINRETYDAIEGGMTEEDVTRLFGVPAGEYNRRPVMRPGCGMGLPYQVYDPDSRSTHFLYWTGDESEVSVDLDKNGRVISKRYVPVWPARRNFIDMLRALLKL